MKIGGSCCCGAVKFELSSEPPKPYIYGRCFCKICGSSLGEILSDEDSFPIAANALDGKLNLRNQSHEFVAEKPSWYEICDDAPQNEGHPENT